METADYSTVELCMFYSEIIITVYVFTFKTIFFYKKSVCFQWRLSKGKKIVYMFSLGKDYLKSLWFFSNVGVVQKKRGVL